MFYFRALRGPRIRLPNDYGSPAFWAAYESAKADPYTPAVWDSPQKRAADRAIRRAISRTQSRCAQRGSPFGLTVEWALAQMASQDYRCVLTGIRFMTEKPGQSYMHPFAPSFDRIDPRGDYTVDNVRIVVFAINSMLLDWGLPVFQRVADALRRQETKRARRASLTEGPGAGTGLKT